MFYLKTVDISGFWGDKKVLINLNEHVNFLIGVNGSGKTTIINLIAACLKADYNSLDKIQFTKILITLRDVIESSQSQCFIEIAKDLNNSHLIRYKIKNKINAKGDEYLLSQEVDEEEMNYNIRISHGNLFNDNQNIKKILSELVSISWLSINRSTNVSVIRRLSEKNRNTTIDCILWRC